MSLIVHNRQRIYAGREAEVLKTHGQHTVGLQATLAPYVPGLEHMFRIGFLWYNVHSATKEGTGCRGMIAHSADTQAVSLLKRDAATVCLYTMGYNL